MNPYFHEEDLLIGTTEVFFCGIVHIRDGRTARLAGICINPHAVYIIVSWLEIGLLLLRQLRRKPFQSACRSGE